MSSVFLWASFGSRFCALILVVSGAVWDITACRSRVDLQFLIYIICFPERNVLLFINRLTVWAVTVLCCLQGTAVFWYNLYPSGEGDYRTRHAACPVLVGNKWGEFTTCLNIWKHTRLRCVNEPAYIHTEGVPSHRPQTSVRSVCLCCCCVFVPSVRGWFIKWSLIQYELFKVVECN